MNKTNVISINNKETNEEFRKYYWYDCLHHINNRIVKGQEFLLKEYYDNKIDKSLLYNMHEDFEILTQYFKPFGYDEYELNDLKRTHHIVIDYINKKGS